MIGEQNTKERLIQTLEDAGCNKKQLMKFCYYFQKRKKVK